MLGPKPCKDTVFERVWEIGFEKQLPRLLAKDIALTGEQIRLARLRRNLTMEQVAERAQCSMFLGSTRISS